MKKLPKWRVHVAVTNYHCVDIDETNDHNLAIQEAISLVQSDPDYYQTCETISLAGIFINDRETHYYAPYVPEKMPKPKREINSDDAKWESNSQ